MGFHPLSFSWWGGLSYAVGAVLYNVGATANLVYQFPSVTLTDTQLKYLSPFPYTFGGDRNNIMLAQCLHQRKISGEAPACWALFAFCQLPPLPCCATTPLLAGGLFLLAGACYIWEHHGILGAYKGGHVSGRHDTEVPCTAQIPKGHIPATGILLPLRREDWTSISWWVDWLNFYGGLGFCVASV